jgi:hypothetical protein
MISLPIFAYYRKMVPFHWHTRSVVDALQIHHVERFLFGCLVAFAVMAVPVIARHTSRRLKVLFCYSCARLCATPYICSAQMVAFKSYTAVTEGTVYQTVVACPASGQDRIGNFIRQSSVIITLI